MKVRDAGVIIVGAGPVGLLTAIELALGGACVVVLEGLATPSLAMKAMSVGPLGTEALQRRGMAEAIAAAEARNFAAIEATGAVARGRSSKYSGHFAGLSLIRKDAQKEPDRRARPVDQPSLEAILSNRARALGIEVRRGCAATAIVDDADGVEVHVVSENGERRLRCSYLVACDGGRSSMRELAGFDFPGTPPSLTFYQVVAEIDYPDRLFPIGWQRTPHGVFSYGPFPGRLVMLDFNGPPEHREAPVTREEIEAVLRRISGADVRVNALETGSRWTDNTRLVDTYRRGHVLLAGDAAHIHSPFGGQGLNLGLVDAANLGWKLAAVTRGDMPDALLDTYTSERRPVAEAVLANTLAQTALLRPDVRSGAIRDLIAKLMDFDDVNRTIGEMMTGLAVRYDLGSDIDDVGRLIGDAPIDGTGSIYERMQDGSGLLLDGSKHRRASEIARHTLRIRSISSGAGRSILLRPDACIAWAGDGENVDGLHEALNAWFPFEVPGER